MSRKRTGLRNKKRNGRGTYSRKHKADNADRYAKFVNGERQGADRLAKYTDGDIRRNPAPKVGNPERIAID